MTLSVRNVVKSPCLEQMSLFCALSYLQGILWYNFLFTYLSVPSAWHIANFKEY